MYFEEIKQKLSTFESKHKGLSQNENAAALSVI